jgi:prepilin-type N-terminal cleavage/methylation domain-containing protein
MQVTRSCQRRGFTLLEVSLVIGIVLLITMMVVPNLIDEFKREELPGSARQLRSLLTLVSANAAFDGKRYRIRFCEDGEEDALGGDQQPLVEREDDPFEEPDVFNLVTDPWAVGNTFLGEVWCAEIRLGRPTIERLRERRSQIEEALDEEFEDFDARRLPLIFEPDGTSEWATFVVVADAPRGIDVEQLEDYERIEVIYEGETGLAWLQRPFYEEELDLFEEKNWPAVLRQDFLRSAALTEDDVLEIHEVRVRDDEVPVPDAASSDMQPE